MNRVRISVQALANHVHGDGATGRKREAERRLDRQFPKGLAFAETTHSGDLRIMSLDESAAFNVPAHLAGRIVRGAMAS